LLNLHVQVKLP